MDNLNVASPVAAQVQARALARRVAVERAKLLVGNRGPAMGSTEADAESGESARGEMDFSELDPKPESLGAEPITGPEWGPAGADDALEISCGNPDLWLYRDRTVAILRRYMRLSIEVGRLPSLLGREFFRTRVTSYHHGTFEDSVIFVHDVERSLEKLDDFEKTLIAKLVLQNYSQEEAANHLHCSHRSVRRRYLETLDRVSTIFLERKILLPLPASETKCPESCQEGEAEENAPSDLEHDEKNFKKLAYLP